MAEKLQIVIEAQDKASGVLDKIGGAVGGLGKLAGGALVGGLAAGAGAVIGLTAALSDCVSAAGEAELIQSQLNAVLESTGGAAGMTADEVNDLALSLSSVTMFEDDAIVRGEALLLTFTGIGEEVFPQATEAMLNMSQALGQDLQSSATMLGKALNNPIEGVTALRRVGVMLTDAQEETIKKMVEMGDVAGAQAIILGELETEFGGVARAAGETFPGKMEILKNKFGNLKEEIGTALLPALGSIADKLIEVFDKPEVTEAIAKIGTWLAENLPKAIEWLWNALMWLGDKVIGPLFNWIRDNVIPILKDVFAWLGEKVPEAINWLGDAFQWVKNNVLEPIAKVFGAISDAIGWVIDKIKEVIDWFGRVKDSLPDWLIPGSPTPFELGIRGITEAMAELAGMTGPMIGGLTAIPGEAASVVNNYNNYSMSINTQAETEQVAADFQMMRALAGA